MQGLWWGAAVNSVQVRDIFPTRDVLPYKNSLPGG